MSITYLVTEHHISRDSGFLRLYPQDILHVLWNCQLVQALKNRALEDLRNISDGAGVQLGEFLLVCLSGVLK